MAVAGSILASHASAQTAPVCQAIGTYGFVLSSGNFFTPVTSTPPGTTLFPPTGATPPGTTVSNTQVGQLLGGVAGATSGSATGQLFFDGNGQIFGASAPTAAPNTLVGTYTITPECLITVSLNDAFSTTVPRPGAVSFTGFVLNGGAEIDLAPSTQLTGGAGTTTPVPPRALIRLVRTSPQQGCSVASLTGPYVLVGDGVVSATTGTAVTTPLGTSFAFLARLRFDGNGNIVAEPGTPSATLALFQYTGTYTVNSDCTGTLSIGLGAPPATTAPGTTPPTTTPARPTITANFVLTNPMVQVNGSGISLFVSPSHLRPSLIFTLTNQTQIISGTGTAQ